MDYRNRSRFWKFYEKQIEECLHLIEKFVKSSSDKIDVDKYLLICEKLGQEPDPNRMPPSLSEAPEEIQVAFFIYSALPDRYDSMAGVYQGKDLAPLESLYKIYDVTNQEVVTTFLLKIQQVHSAQLNKQLEQKRKASGSKSGKSIRPS